MPYLISVYYRRTARGKEFGNSTLPAANTSG
jgi:hypothetical protein